MAKGYPPDDGYNARITRLEEQMRAITARSDEPAEVKSCAAQTQATQHLYAPLRSDVRAVLDLAAFARRLLEANDLGCHVTETVRREARKALGLPEEGKP